MRHRIAIDSVIDERYQVLSHLGTGGMAEVYCAHDLQLGRKVALKVLHERFAADETFVERFKREASSAAGLQHQHVVSVYDRGEWDGTSYIAMEYVAGRTLKQLVTADGPLEPARAVDLTVQILRAARFAHRRGIIHRDFKPHNVIVDDEDRAKVTDFGIARAGASDMTQTGSIMGTAQYLSPEQAQGHAVTGRSDLYSIGIVLYELLTGKVPFEAESPVTIALKQVSETPVPPSQLNPAVTAELESVVLCALAKDPADRFADADEFIAALEAARSRIPTAAAIAAAEAAAASLPASAAEAGAVVTPTRDAAARSRAYPGTGESAGATSGSSPSYEPYSPQYEKGDPLPLAPPRPRRRRPRWPVWLVGALLLVGATALLVALTAPKRVTVPDVVASSVSVAQQRLRNDGFRVEIVRDNSDKPRNTVTGQDPQGDTTADEGSLVTLNVSDGLAITEVPDVVGQARTKARATLKSAGFGVEEVLKASDEVPRGNVISQSISGGSQAEQGQEVKIEVSMGPEHALVPAVTGKTEDDARSTLEAVGFRVAVQSKEDEKADPGTVLAQDPGRGQDARRGARVTITVAIEPRQVAVPDVVGRSQNLATKTLSGRGFEVTVEEEEVDTVTADGIVRSQSPAPDEGKVDRGSTVTITVGRFDPNVDPDPPTTTTTPPPPATTTTPPVAPPPPT